MYKDKADKVAYARAYYAANRERILAHVLVRPSNWIAGAPRPCKKCGIEFSGIRCIPCTRKWRRAWEKKTYQENPGVRDARTAKRRAAKMGSMPPWANSFFIEEAYSLAKLRSKVTGIKWEVDHVVPLQSKTVCGLHAETNVRVIPAILNHTKGNRHWPDMPCNHGGV